MTTTPLPATDPVAQPEEEPFYDGLLAGEVRVPWCEQCACHVWRPKSHCTTCYQPVSGWRTLAGTGDVYSYCVVHNGTGSFAGIGPYVLAWVRLDGGPTILANIDAPPTELAIGVRVCVLAPQVGNQRRRGPVFVLC